MFNQEIELFYKSFENNDTYNNILKASGAEGALFTTQKASIR
ncbi:hypothetical protein [Psychromonas sp. MB-3u-54]|nr:hypothetical protein [Psychromonas sp. MB-3u-54]